MQARNSSASTLSSRLGAGGHGSIDGALGREAALRLGDAAQLAIKRLDSAAAVRLLGRAVPLLPADAAQRLALEIELGHALKNEGAIAASIAVLSSVEERARIQGDRHTELRASVELAWSRVVIGEETVVAVRTLADEAMPFFEKVGDLYAAGRAARMRSNADDMSMEYAAAESDCLRAIAYFDRDGSRSMDLVALAAFKTVGPTPVDLALRSIEGMLADSSRSPAEHGYFLTRLGEIKASVARSTRRAEPRRCLESHREFAQLFALATVWPYGASRVEMLSGNPAAAETILGEALLGLYLGSTRPGTQRTWPIVPSGSSNSDA